VKVVLKDQTEGSTSFVESNVLTVSVKAPGPRDMAAWQHLNTWYDDHKHSPYLSWGSQENARPPGRDRVQLIWAEFESFATRFCGLEIRCVR